MQRKDYIFTLVILGSIIPVVSWDMFATNHIACSSFFPPSHKEHELHQAVIGYAESSEETRQQVAGLHDEVCDVFLCAMRTEWSVHSTCIPA